MPSRRLVAKFAAASTVWLRYAMPEAAKKRLVTPPVDMPFTRP